MSLSKAVFIIEHDMKERCSTAISVGNIGRHQREKYLEPYSTSSNYLNRPISSQRILKSSIDLSCDDTVEKNFVSLFRTVSNIIHCSS